MKAAALYHRVSTRDQNPKAARVQLRAAARQRVNMSKKKDDEEIERAVREMEAAKAILEAIRPLNRIARRKVLAACATLYGINDVASALLDQIEQLEQEEEESP